MLQQQLLKLARYNRWANERCTGYVMAAGESLADQEQPSSFPTIRKTIYHIWDAELTWLSRLNGKTIARWPPSADFTGTLGQGMEELLSVSDKFIDFIQHISEENLQQAMSYTTSNKTPFNTKICDMITHCLNHSTYHRGQIITMLRGVDFTEVGSTDYIGYCRLS